MICAKSSGFYKVCAVTDQTGPSSVKIFIDYCVNPREIMFLLGMRNK